MAPTKAGVCPLLLLLLLGLWVAKVPVSAKPKHMTSAQWFETQHVQPNPEGCKKAMGKINRHTKHCKGLNTFLHESFSSVAATCHLPTITCRNSHENCHQSKGTVSLTMCELTSGKHPDCRYKEKKLSASYIVACDPPQKGDSGKFHLVPVHLDKVL
ncbi:ribonuclease A family member 7 [Rhinolophus ferrumequinum]|uniref:Ribonuclease A family member 7 n=1 Tax=Rhinolophus ferrumequinum TaxID=59479 RepID=A0A671FN35_RHIFE|nr:ribonuclease 7-like [Rhinolophus ferrumequinum]XP_032964562.1 ribonuclease 7-like [Rhinolophus ferrumequinum]KAF6352285.1 ribonuclease A family member 7 [Rhinolophus ferrumequinum]